MQNLSLNTEIWVAGKGPSFDKFLWLKAGQTIGINETAVLIPNCFGAAATDLNVLKYYTKNLLDSTIVFNMLTNPMVYYRNQVIWEVGKEVRQFIGGTANLLIEVLAKYGVKKIHFVGFDSIDGIYRISRKVSSLNISNSRVSQYDEINKHILEALEYTGIEPVWEHRLEAY